MHKYLSLSLNSVVSIDAETSWAAKNLQQALEQARYDARFQQKQIQEREEKLLQLYENQKQKAFERLNRSSAGSTTSLGSTGGGKVRQMFDERRQKAGIDRSYPLEPLKVPKSNNVKQIKGTTSRTMVRSTVQKSVNHIRNGQTVVNKQEIVHSIYNNNDGDENYSQERIENGNFNKTYDKSHSDLIAMMQNHSLEDTLDNEKMPLLENDDLKGTYVTGKLANVGGKLPSEIVASSGTPNNNKTPRSALGKTFKKDTKPIIKRTVKPASSSNSLTSSPSPPQTMQSKPAPVKKGAAQPPQSAKAPCNTRPSAKQTAKSPIARDDLNECRYCGRRFASDRLETHESICGKTSKKKRKVYDATKHRVEGTELEQFVRRGKNLNTKAPPKPASKKDWRRTHEDFINTIRAAKMAQAHVAKGGKLSDLPPPPPSSNPDYIQCPHCGRKFNEAAAERHIPKCANFIFNKPKPGAPVKGKASGKSLR